jgi:hypothetical protein
MMIGDGDGLKALFSAGLNEAPAVGYALVIGDSVRARPTQIARGMNLEIATIEMRSPVHK